MPAALTSVTHAARIYRTRRCMPLLPCRAIRMDPGGDRWEFVCTRPVTTCVHIELLSGDAPPTRTGFCEEHSIGVRHMPGMSVVTRMHSIPAGYGVDARSDR